MPDWLHADLLAAAPPEHPTPHPTTTTTMGRVLLQAVEVRLTGDEASDYLNFVVKDTSTGEWYDLNGTNFQVRIPLTQAGHAAHCLGCRRGTASASASRKECHSTDSCVVVL